MTCAGHRGAPLSSPVSTRELWRCGTLPRARELFLLFTQLHRQCSVHCCPLAHVNEPSLRMLHPCDHRGRTMVLHFGSCQHPKCQLRSRVDVHRFWEKLWRCSICCPMFEVCVLSSPSLEPRSNTVCLFVLGWMLSSPLLPPPGPSWLPLILAKTLRWVNNYVGCVCAVWLRWVIGGHFVP